MNNSKRFIVDFFNGDIKEIDITKETDKYVFSGNKRLRKRTKYEAIVKDIEEARRATYWYWSDKHSSLSKQMEYVLSKWEIAITNIDDFSQTNEITEKK